MSPRADGALPDGPAADGPSTDNQPRPDSSDAQSPADRGPADASEEEDSTSGSVSLEQFGENTDSYLRTECGIDDPSGIARCSAAFAGCSGDDLDKMQACIDERQGCEPQTLEDCIHQYLDSSKGCGQGVS